jgi:hypothetical protein
MAPIVPVANPKTRAMKTNSKALQHAYRPDDADDGEHHDGDPGDRRHHSEHHLEQDVDGDQEDGHGEQLAGGV